MSRRHLEIDSLRLWHPYTASPAPGPAPALLARAEGAFVFDAEGRRYFDATSSWWCQIHGHCHPRLVAALARQAARLDQVLFSPHTHEVAVDLADGLVKVLGAPFSRVFFSDDGSTAVEAAMKMALQFWYNRGESRRRQFLSIGGAYHGDTLGAIGCGYVPGFHAPFESLIKPSFQSTEPYCYRCPEGLEYPSCGIRCLSPAKRLLEERGSEIAALVVEPLVLGASGMIVYPLEYLRELVQAARAAGTLVIFDEVFTGFGRTGTFFAMQRLEDRPDIVCLSKGLTSGMLALGATVTTEAIFDAFRGGEEKKLCHGHTFTANAIACAVANESLKIFEEERVIERNRALEATLASWTPRFLDLPHVGEVRHVGLIWALELVADKKSRAVPRPAHGPGWRVASELWKKGQWIRPLGNVVYTVPPYCSTPDDLNQCLGLLYAELRNESHFTDFS